MISTAVIFISLVLLIAMICTMTFTGNRYYGVRIWKCIILGISLTVLCLFSSRLMAIIESARGLSLFGGVLFAPVLMIPVSLLLHVSLFDMWDMSALSAALALSIAKIHCLFNECCNGRFLFYFGSDMQSIFFPSQIIESMNTLILFCLLLQRMKRKQYRGGLILWAMIYYGITRFGLTFMRMDRDPFVWILPNGAFWSLVTLMIAVPLMILYKRRCRIIDSAGRNAKA